MLDKLEDLANYSMYVTDQNKKNIEYGFWVRPTISWSIECELEHSRDSVVEAAIFEKEKEPLNETAVIVQEAIMYGVGFLVALVMTGCFVRGNCNKRDLGEVYMKGPIGCCLGIQMIVLIVVVVFIFGQQEELMERD